jgi:hypothetical protein
VNGNKNIYFEFYLRRNIHPFIRAHYNNGYMKDISLRRMERDEISVEFSKIRESCI